MSQKAAAAAFCVSPATAHRWWHRRPKASPAELASGAWLLDRRSRPRRSPRRLDAAAERRTCEARLRTGWGPRLIAGATAHPHSTVWKASASRALTTPASGAREPHRPRTNGKVERFHQTMAREWAYGVSYRSHRHRNWALRHWLEHYNGARPHSSLGGRPPISRVHNVFGQDT